MPENILKGALLCSGMYDLAPVRLSKRSEYVKFTDAMENALSAQRHIARLNMPLAVAYGTNELPEFMRQAQDFVKAVTAAGKPAELIVAEGYNHFEIAETLASPYGILGRAALRMMEIGVTPCERVPMPVLNKYRTSSGSHPDRASRSARATTAPPPSAD